MRLSFCHFVTNSWLPLVLRTLLRHLQLITKIFFGGLSISSPPGLLLRSHTLVIHIHMLAYLSHPSLVLYFLMVCLTIYLVIRLFSPISLHLVIYLLSPWLMVPKSNSKGLELPIPSLLVDSIFYVSGDTFNLLSISPLTRSHNCLITFTKE